jgi:hypothetical protein
MRRSHAWFIAVGLLMLAQHAIAAPPAAPPAPAVSPDDEKLLKTAKVGVEPADLVAFFRKNTLSPVEQEKLFGLIHQLGDDSFKVRQKASAELTALGAAAAPYLRRALDDADEEIKDRAHDLLTALGPAAEERSALTAAAARVFRAKTPDGAAAVLLAFLPDADGDAAEEETLAALATTAVKDAKVDAAVAAALKDKNPARRAAAALVLGRSGTDDQKKDAQALLADPDPRVRFRTAQGLLAGRDRAGLPVLVALVNDGPADLAARADDLLACAAGVRAPHAPFYEDAMSRRACADAWSKWQKSFGKTVDLTNAAVDLPPLNAALRSRETVRQFFGQLVQHNNLDAFKKTVDAPLMANNGGGPQLFKTKEDVDAFFNNNALNLAGTGQMPYLVATLPVKEYLHNAAPAESEFATAAKWKAGDVAVYLVQMNGPGQMVQPPNPPGQGWNGYVVVVRLTGDQPRVVAVSPRGGIAAP